MPDKLLQEASPMEITWSAPTVDARIVDSEDKTSTTTGAGDSNMDCLNSSQLLRDEEAVEDGTEETLTSIPINQVLI